MVEKKEGARVTTNINHDVYLETLHKILQECVLIQLQVEVYILLFLIKNLFRTFHLIKTFVHANTDCTKSPHLSNSIAIKLKL